MQNNAQGAIQGSCTSGSHAHCFQWPLLLVRGRMFCWTDCHIPLFSETPEGCQAKPRTSTPIFSLNAISR